MADQNWENLTQWLHEESQIIGNGVHAIYQGAINDGTIENACKSISETVIKEVLEKMSDSTIKTLSQPEQANYFINGFVSAIQVLKPDFSISEDDRQKIMQIFETYGLQANATVANLANNLVQLVCSILKK